jgi:hypothetical protein
MLVVELAGKHGHAHERFFTEVGIGMLPPGFLSPGSDHLQGHLIFQGYTFLNERCCSQVILCA